MTTAPTNGTSAQINPAETKTLLSVLFDDKDNVHLRPIETWTEGGRKHSRVLYSQQTSLPVNIVTSESYLRDYFPTLESEKANAFFGVCPRQGSSHQKAWQIKTVRALWCDVDGCTVEEALQRIEQAGLPEPTIVVSSGNGGHFYWKLSEPIDTDAPDIPLQTEFPVIDGKKRCCEFFYDDDRKKVWLKDPVTGQALKCNEPALTLAAQSVQDTLQGIAAAIGGDHTFDLSRLLRLPGTLNRKNERNGDKPKPCTLVRCDPDKVYPFEDFAKFAAQAPAKIRRDSVAKMKLPKPGTLTANRENKLADSLNRCAAADTGDRSEADFGFCCAAIRNQVGPEDAWSLCQHVGKFAEGGREYFDTTWANAANGVKKSIYEKTTGDFESENRLRKGDAADLDPPCEAEEILEIFFNSSTVSRLVRWRNEFYQYDCKSWQQKDAESLLALIANHLGERFEGLGTRDLNNVLAFVRAKTHLDGETEFSTWLDGSERGPRLAVQNGLLNPTTGKLEPHNRDWFSPVILPVTHDPNAKCEKWISSLVTNLEGDSERHDVLQEFAGYCLWPKLSFHKFLTLYGDGGDGKSTFIAGLQALLGDRNVSNYSLSSLGENRFAAAGTIGKLANLCADISEINRFSEGVLKQLVSGDRITVEEKYKPLVEATPTAKLVFSANNLPRFSDRSAGTLRRMLVVPFNRPVPPDEIVDGMDSPEYWKDELPGILNWALIGLARLLKNRRFTHSTACQSLLDEYRRDNNPAAVFIEEHLTVSEDPEAYVIKSEIYLKYREWCTTHGRKPLRDSEFGKEINKAITGVGSGRPRIDGYGRAYVYTGVIEQNRVEIDSDAFEL